MVKDKCADDNHEMTTSMHFVARFITRPRVDQEWSRINMNYTHPSHHGIAFQTSQPFHTNVQPPSDATHEE